MSILNQTHIMDLNDRELLEFLGYCYEEIKNLEEQMKNDDEILELEAKLKNLKNDKYADRIRGHKAMLRAARALAHAKGLAFNPPEKLE